MSRLFYAAQGVIVTSKNSNPSPETFYLNGVQSIGVDKSWSTLAIADIGRAQPVDNIYLKQESGSISIDRVISNYTDETDKCVGPFLHKIFFKNNTNPTNYKEGFFLKNNGIVSTGNILTDIKEYDISLLYQQPNDIKLTNSPERAIFKGLFNQCLLNSLSYNISQNEITESLGFEFKSLEVSTDAEYEKSLVTLGDTYQSGSRIRKKINPRDFNKTQSLFPSILEDVVRNGTMFDGSEVFGITEISTSISMSYSQVSDEGRWGGTHIEEDNNNLTFLSIPIEVSCNFKFTARKGLSLSLYNRPEFNNSYMEKYPIRLAFNSRNFLNSSNDLFIIDMGSKNVATSLEITGGSTSGDLVEYSMGFKNSSSDFVTYFTPAASPIFLIPTERY